MKRREMKCLSKFGKSTVWPNCVGHLHGTFPLFFKPRTKDFGDYHSRKLGHTT